MEKYVFFTSKGIHSTHYHDENVHVVNQTLNVSVMSFLILLGVEEMIEMYLKRTIRAKTLLSQTWCLKRTHPSK